MKIAVSKLMALILCIVGIGLGQITYLDENFEFGNASMFSDSGGGWQRGTPNWVGGPTTVPQGAQCIGTIINGNYGNNATYHLTSDWITLGNYWNIYLSFYEWFKMESGYDFLYIYIQKRNESSWTPIRSTKSYTATYAWDEETIDLGRYRNSEIRIRFTLRSNVSNAYAGWYLDRIRLYVSATYNMLLTNDGNGTTSPSGTLGVERGVLYPIIANPNSGYEFSNWAITGNASVTAPSLSNTTVSLSGDAALRANFISFPHDTIIFNTGYLGIISVSDTLLLRTNTETWVTATALGGNVFQRWSKDQLFLSILDTMNRYTRFSFPNSSGGHKVNVRVYFGIDAAVVPNVTISDIDISSHPDICVTAAVRDFRGRSVVGLDTSNFILSQDGEQLNYQLSTNANTRGVSVCLVVDRSGSMGPPPYNNQIIPAKNSAIQFVRTMSSNDRCAVVSYAYDATVDQGMTSDTVALINAISFITADGGTATTDGAIAGINQLINETNSRSVILFSDGDNNWGNTNIDSAIARARANNVTVYTIGLGTSAGRVMLQRLADSTGGYFSESPTADGLAAIYAQIKRDIEAQYILCYQTPDVIFNGDTHQVVVTVNVNARSSRDTTYWNENNRAPVIELTQGTNALIGSNQPANRALTLRAVITDDGVIQSARCFFRTSSITTQPYSDSLMRRVAGDTFQVIIPANLVRYPGIDFYITASDNYHLVGRSPNVLAPENQPYVIPIANEVPRIQSISDSCITPNTPKVIAARIFDSDGTLLSLLYYKRTTETFFRCDTMAEVSQDSFQGTIPAVYINNTGVHYYIRAVDDRGAAVRYPIAGFIAAAQCNTNHPPQANAGRDTTLYVTSTSCQLTASLDGSRSTDAGNDIQRYVWYSGLPNDSLVGAVVNPVLSTGTHRYRLVVTDAAGLTDDDTVVVTVADTSAPLPRINPLPDITGECSASVRAPFADDNCSSVVVGTTSDSTSYSSEGTYIIHWRYPDLNGNVRYQNQTVRIHDATPPVPDVATLPDITGECSVMVTTVPTATDGCSGRITANLPDSLQFTTQGTRQITWTYTDAQGNDVSQVQRVIVRDITAPVPSLAVLPTITAECSVDARSVTAPTANDLCSGIITGTTVDTLPFTTQGNHTIRWQFNDGHGNISTQEQVVVIRDVTPPVPQTVTLPILQSECAVLLTAPAALDNCNGVIAGTTPVPLIVNQQGTHTIEWVYNDGNGNTISQNQTVIIRDTTPPVLTELQDTTINIRAVDSTAIGLLSNINSTDNCSNTRVTITRSDNRQPGDPYYRGMTRVKWVACDTSGNCDSTFKHITVRSNQLPVCTVVRDTSITERQELIFQFRLSDPDGAVPHISTFRTPTGSVFVDNRNGTGSFAWTPDCMAHGRHVIRFDFTDGIDVVSDSIVITVTDKNFPPVIESVPDKVTSEQVPLSFTVNVTDCDGTIPSIRMVNFIIGAQFIDNQNGSGSFTWIPECHQNGYYVAIFEAADETFRVRDTAIIRVNDVNCFAPVLTLSSGDTAISANQPFTLVANASDRDRTVPVIKVIEKPVDASFAVGTDGVGVFNWTPRTTGVWYLTIRAFDKMDTTAFVTKSIRFNVDSRNVTGPEISVIDDILLSQNNLMQTTISASDPDGTIPYISLISAPAGVNFSDQRNGTAIVSWTPACDQSGNFIFTVLATDNQFSDTLRFNVIVNDINCPPVINPVADRSVAAGDVVKFSVYAYDPDNDANALTLSTSAMMPNATFSVDNNGSGIFTWPTLGQPVGTSYVSFYASDGYATDSIIVAISVGKTGTTIIKSGVKGTRFYGISANQHTGKYLGIDSVAFIANPGNYRINGIADGYRAYSFNCPVKADSVKHLSVSLKPAIPLMFRQSEKMRFGVSDTIQNNGTKDFCLADLNGDGFNDLVILTDTHIAMYPGLDTTDLRYSLFSEVIMTSANVLVSFSVADWNNDNVLDLIITDTTGTVYIASKVLDRFVYKETIIQQAGQVFYPLIVDFNNDAKKDIILNSIGKGINLYINDGSDSLPHFTTGKLLHYVSGEIVLAKGKLHVVNTKGLHTYSLIINTDSTLKEVDVDAQFTVVEQISILNVAGSCIKTISNNIALTGSPFGQYILTENIKNRFFVYRSGLSGDVNRDYIVDGKDLNVVSKAFTINDKSLNWNRILNLRYIGSGTESIDIRDLSKAAKSFELHE
jgi:VWFA-related protein